MSHHRVLEISLAEPLVSLQLKRRFFRIIASTLDGAGARRREGRSSGRQTRFDFEWLARVSSRGVALPTDGARSMTRRPQRPHSDWMTRARCYGFACPSGGVAVAWEAESAELKNAAYCLTASGAK